MEQALRPPPHAPLSDNDLSTARAAEPLPKGLARREYFQARSRMNFWHGRAANASLELVRALHHHEPSGALLEVATGAVQFYEDCIGHFHNAQANYRAVGGKV